MMGFDVYGLTLPPILDQKTSSLRLIFCSESLLVSLLRPLPKLLRATLTHLVVCKTDLAAAFSHRVTLMLILLKPLAVAC